MVQVECTVVFQTSAAVECAVTQSFFWHYCPIRKEPVTQPVGGTAAWHPVSDTLESILTFRRCHGTSVCFSNVIDEDDTVVCVDIPSQRKVDSCKIPCKIIILCTLFPIQFVTLVCYPILVHVRPVRRPHHTSLWMTSIDRLI